MAPSPVKMQDIFVDQEDPFDGSSEPTVYMSENRMPVMIEFNNIVIYIVFSALILSFLFILPGVRRTKLTSFLSLLTILTVGASIFLALEGSNWLTGSININNVQYSSLTKETLSGKLEINIGLSWTNVSLTGKLMKNEINSDQVDKSFNYNERFFWSNPERMLEEHYEALQKGLPYPILTVTEFLSQDTDGFNWTRQLRQAGYYTSLALYLSLASWALTCLVMCVLPIYMAHMLQITGTFMMSSVWIYTLLVQSPKLYSIQIAGSQLDLAFGSSYATTFVAGALSMIVGLILMAIQLSNPKDKQLTIMDSDQFVNDQRSLVRGRDEVKSVIIPIKDIEENFGINLKGSAEAN